MKTLTEIKNLLQAIKKILEQIESNTAPRSSTWDLGTGEIKTERINLPD